MLELSDLKPLQRQCLQACIVDPQQKLTRVRGGYAPTANRATTFTTRTVNGLESIGLLRRDSEFDPEAELTAPGRRLAEQLRDSSHAKAAGA